MQRSPIRCHLSGLMSQKPLGGVRISTGPGQPSGPQQQGMGLEQNQAGLQGKKHIRSGDRDNDSSLSNSRGSHVFPVHSMFLL